MELEIEIWFHSDETAKLKDAGIDYSVLECDTRNMTFYFISCIVPYEDEASGKWFCKIFSAGDDHFIATKSYEEIKELIHDHKKVKS